MEFLICLLGLFVLAITIEGLRAYHASKTKALLHAMLDEMCLSERDIEIHDFDDRITVKSKSTLNNYDDIKYASDKINFNKIKQYFEINKKNKETIQHFLKSNQYQTEGHYLEASYPLKQYVESSMNYIVQVIYVTTAGNIKSSKQISIPLNRMIYFTQHPELFMSKSEYNKMKKEEERKLLEEKKHEYYNRVNTIIQKGNDIKKELIIKHRKKDIDSMLEKLYNGTIHSIAKVKNISSDEWVIIDTFIKPIEEDINLIIQEQENFAKYYASDEFATIQETCKNLMNAQKDFNTYIAEKSQAIATLFGSRIVRNETYNNDSCNYIRAYQKSINPFTAEVSSTVFSSAENNPITYIIKYFYPDKTKYKEYIQNLQMLLVELETLKEAKSIIDSYKQEYLQYISNVPSYILKKDESGFYQRLGLTIIDEDVLHTEYKFSYTSDGGMAQRFFTVPMTEENITELISEMERKLTFKEFAKEQRALMTPKLRAFIKKRDNFTCQCCGNSTYEEPNLLLEVDHILPIAKGGTTEEGNLQTLCWKCNRSKGAKII